jgi:hypothetical protein
LEGCYPSENPLIFGGHGQNEHWALPRGSPVFFPSNAGVTSEGVFVSSSKESIILRSSAFDSLGFVTGLHCQFSPTSAFEEIFVSSSNTEAMILISSDFEIPEVAGWARGK